MSVGQTLVEKLFGHFSSGRHMMEKELGTSSLIDKL